MSYILDALKKSEQERGQGKIPDVQTIHSSSLAYRQEKKSWWPYVLIAAIALNLAAIIYFNIDRIKSGDKAENTTETIINTATEVITTAPVTEPSLPVTTEATIKTATRPEAAANTRQSTLDQTQARKHGKPVSGPLPAETVETTSPVAETQPASEIADYNDLPESFREQLPAIRITAHVFSSNPQQRSVVINNNFMEEGEYVLDGMVLYEITKTGVIFSYHDTLFHYNVVSGWQ